jgi:hypothetical protein
MRTTIGLLFFANLIVAFILNGRMIKKARRKAGLWSPIYLVEALKTPEFYLFLLCVPVGLFLFSLLESFKN